MTATKHMTSAAVQEQAWGALANLGIDSELRLPLLQPVLFDFFLFELLLPVSVR